MKLKSVILLDNIENFNKSNLISFVVFLRSGMSTLVASATDRRNSGKCYRALSPEARYFANIILISY